MSAFMDRDFLLNTETAKRLYHGTAEKLPIIDYHCHLDPREIWEDVRFENITRVWLGGDHYKWRLMRAAGVEERYITGDASDREKFEKYAEVLGKAIGNPLYHWSHLELRRYFGYEGVLNRQTAGEVWEKANAALRRPEYSARGLIRMSGVRVICTTDDPADSLEWHEKLAADDSFPVKVLPAWRPDRAVDPEKADWPEYVARLGAAAGREITCMADLKEALRARMDHFAARGCVLSDHGLSRVVYAPAPEAETEEIFRRRMEGTVPGPAEADRFRYALLTFLAAEYRRRNWVMQLHYGCRRNNNPPAFRTLGPDTGFDCMDDHTPSAETAAFLGALEEAGSLPKTILYSLNPKDNEAIDTIAGCFQNAEAAGRIQHGSAWWFNDHFDGMTAQMKSLAAQGRLAGFVGMLTDSRSFLSYPRHEYFRRILCRMIGEWVEEGFFPDDAGTLEEIVADVSYYNAERYFFSTARTAPGPETSCRK